MNTTSLGFLCIHDSFHGAEQRRMEVRKSKRSWSEQHQGHHIQASMVECNIANNSNSMEMETPAGSQWTRCGSRRGGTGM